MCRGLKSADGGDGAKAKLLAKKDKKSSKQHISDTGVIDAKAKEDKDHNDSFEKYYNKDLDLDEGRCRNNVGWWTICFLLILLDDMFLPVLVCRPSACRHLRAQRECHQFHLTRKFRKSSDLALESADYAGLDLGSEKLARQICFPADDAQHGTLLPEAGCVRRVRKLS